MSDKKIMEPNAEETTINAQEILSLQGSQLLEKLGSSTAGLTKEEAEKRLEQYGANTVTGKGKTPVVLDFLSHFKNPITIILLAAGILSGVLGDFTNLIIILVIVLISVTLDFTQEYRANRAAETLKKRVATTATVIRDGRKVEVDVTELVLGDIIALSAGDVVPADARVLNARDFFVDQSALTGESFPAEKFSDLPSEVDQSDTSRWTHYLFTGTSVTNGTSTAVVVRTGGDTQYGEIVRRNIERKPETEFERGLRRFGLLILQVSIVLVVFVFVVNAIMAKHTILDSLLFAVALTVGLTPGLLPMILSVNLAKGSTNMAKKGVIVKRLAAIQNFGSMDVLCADKTGTLTENRVTLIKHVDIAGQESEKVLLYSYLNSYNQTGLRNPLDEAILKHSDIKADLYRKIDEIPFDFVRKRLSVVIEDQGKSLLITKGAPEEITKVCTTFELEGHVDELNRDEQDRLDLEYRTLSSQGLRVLGVCYRAMEAKPAYKVADETDMTFVGFVAFMDPLKATAGESMELLRQAGVKLKVLTGDNEIVAANICSQLGFQVVQARRGKTFDSSLGRMVSTTTTEPMNIVKGTEIEAIDDNALAIVVERADIFTRVTPAQKSRIMRALKANGHVVGFIGDGINDTPSMKVADVSISVVNAVDIAKESAEIILLNNDLKIIRDGVIEGRKTFGNTMKYILMAISSNFGNMFSAAAASLFLTFLPMLPIQILLNNLLYSFAQLSIPTDNVDDEYVTRPQRLEIPFVRSFMLFFGPVSSIFDFLTFGVMLLAFHAGPALFQTAWFVESLFTQTLVIFAIRTRRIPFLRSHASKFLVWNIIIVLAVALALPFVILGKFFSFVPLPLDFLLILVVFVVIYLCLVELMKKWFYRNHGK